MLIQRKVEALQESHGDQFVIINATFVTEFGSLSDSVRVFCTHFKKLKHTANQSLQGIVLASTSEITNDHMETTMTRFQ